MTLLSQDLRATNEVSMEQGAILLPLTFGTDGAWPKRIRVNCRDGAVATVRFERDRASSTFSVTRPAEPAPVAPQS